MPRTRREILDEEFLEIRCKILDIAAALDRIDRGEGESVRTDSRWQQLQQALQVLLGEAPRAEQVQMIFSRPYDPEWMAKLLPEQLRQR